MTRPKTLSDADLLAAARAAFVERGYGATTREIARTAGVSEGVLFQRYPTKRELFFAAMVLPAPDPATVANPGGGNAFERLTELTEAMTDYFRQTLPVLLPLMTSPGFAFEEFARRHPDSPLDVLRRRLAQFFADEERAGRVRALEPGAASLMVLSLAQTVAFLERLGAHGGRLPPRFVRAALETLWNGLAPDKPARPQPRRRKPVRRPTPR